MSSSIRKIALQMAMGRSPKWSKSQDFPASEYFAENVFGYPTMKEFLSEEAYNCVMAAVEKGVSMDRRMADQVAAAMKAWAMSKGVTHYTHWFQPLTGRTAEKHDAFLKPMPDGKAIERFDGDQLVQAEPDASSFPSGGLRNTFEARGYTAWDPTSPAFVMGRTLCIPTIFVSYTGEMLDYKAPLMKSSTAVERSALEVMKYFDKTVTRVLPTLGWEQEYFLVDSAFYRARPDLLLTGRTLFGHSSSKGQQLEDHYFGSIPDRVMAFMQEFEYEALRLGIPVTTRHNEVAPNQYELAPMFEEVNTAVDHNQLVMDVLEKVANRHDFHILFHEKPFQQINGSGKHNNWSLATDTGINLLSPGKTPKTNLRFLTFFVNTIMAVFRFSDLMRAAIASASNDHRLGANEAPPAIISVFIGSQLSDILDEIVEKVHKGSLTPDEKTDLKLRIGRIPDILIDNTDRNRTSPFAFTGNKFEFRAVGSSANCANSMIVLNTIMAKQLSDFKQEVDKLIKSGAKKDDAIFKVLKKYIIESEKIRFEGNGYSQEWADEALVRGLSNIKTTPYALDKMLDEKNVQVFTEMGVFTETEVHARYDINQEQYRLKIQIESRCLQDLVLNHIIPVSLKQQAVLIQSVANLKEIYGDNFKTQAAPILKLTEEISLRVGVLQEKVELMRQARKKANNLTEAATQAKAYCETVLCYFNDIRYQVDKLELIIDNDQWPVPKYREMLFTR